MDFTAISRLATAHVEARAIQTAVELGVFNALASGPLTAANLAAALGTDCRATELLLNALVALELLRKQADLFSLAEPARLYLVSDSPRSLAGMVRFDASLWSCWERLPEAVRSGNAVRTADMYQNDSRETAAFIEAMDSLVRARGDSDVLAASLDLSGVRELLDVGSGPGTYPIALCRRYPDLRATIFDLPGTMEVTRRFVSAAGLGDRIRLFVGDYRTDPIPGRYDMIFLSNIIHSEGAAENDRLMAKLHAHVCVGGRLVLKDHILDETRTQPAVGAIFSLLMLLTTKSGRCYAFEEVKAWLHRAGFGEISQFPLPPPLTSSLVIARK